MYYKKERGLGIKKDNSVVIIGNGYSALDAKMGKTIDNFDYVVRFNFLGNIDKNHDYIGTKTNILFTGILFFDNLKFSTQIANTYYNIKDCHFYFYVPQNYNDIRYANTCFYLFLSTHSGTYNQSFK